ncbi:hypothetical protein PMAYCL1PPCAC_31852, partial [Pristionchus mayeri]
SVLVDMSEQLQNCLRITTIIADEEEACSTKANQMSSSSVQNDDASDDVSENRPSVESIDEEKEKAFMLKVKGQMEWYTSSVVAIDHSVMSWRAQVINNFDICLRRFDDNDERSERFWHRGQ